MLKVLGSYFTRAVLFCSFVCGAATASADGFSDEQIKKLSTFLSNFTEIGFYTVDNRDFLDPLHPETAIRFGIWHNFVNNEESYGFCAEGKGETKFSDAKGCHIGYFAMPKKYVQNSIMKYLDFTFEDHQSVSSEYGNFAFDGNYYYFEGASGEAVYTRVLKANQDSPGVISCSGTLYNPDNPDEILGTFRAEVSPSEWQGKKLWYLMNIESEFKR
ncbi:MAG: hypothetical protein J6M93_02070 [Succinivibrio sp.]|nr:hypothetical protein [Succinivibrio sp.]